MSPNAFPRRLAPWIALLAALLLAACGQAPATFPAGTFVTNVPDEAIGQNELQSYIVGEWQGTFTPQGRYTLVNKGVDIVRGSYTVSGEQIAFTEESGLYADPGAVVTYTWSLEQGALRFSAVEDPDADRTLMMTAAPWAPAP